MPLLTTREMLRAAQADGYAVGAFNVENLEMAQAVVEAAQALRAPVIVQTTSSTLRYAPPEAFAGIVRALAEAADVPVALHLDHGDSAQLAERCLRAGYTSVMIDGSALPFEGNVALTRQVVDLAQGMPVEAELGKVGGKEDDVEANAAYTEPEEAERFVRLTGVSSFAPAIGTAHGVYKAEPKLDLARLEAIRAAVDVPLALHGTSGVPEDAVRACIARGICKINYATDLRAAFTAAVRAYLAAHGAAFDPKGYLTAGRDAVRARVAELIGVCGSAGRAQ